jgi:hypothetical protein
MEGTQNLETARIIQDVERHPACANDNDGSPPPSAAPGVLWRQWLGQWGTTWAYAQFSEEARGSSPPQISATD